MTISSSHVPVCKHSKGAVSLDDAPHHADLLWPEQLQRQCLAWHQHHSCVWQDRDGLTAIVIVDCSAMKFLHVRAQVLKPQRSHRVNTNISKLLLRPATQLPDTSGSKYAKTYNYKAAASLTACDVGRLGSKVMMLGFSASSLSRSSVSMSSSSSSSSSLSVRAQQVYKETHKELSSQFVAPEGTVATQSVLWEEK